MHRLLRNYAPPLISGRHVERACRHCSCSELTVADDNSRSFKASSSELVLNDCVLPDGLVLAHNFVNQAEESALVDLADARLSHQS